MKTSLGIWAMGSMVTRFMPVGYKPGTKVPVYLKCKAALLSNFCTGSLKLTVDRQTIMKRFRIQTRKMAVIRVQRPKRARLAVSRKTRITLHAKLRISTNQARGRAKVTTGRLNIKTTTHRRVASRRRAGSRH